MPILAALLSPQRSTQYSNLVKQLAGPELQLSPLAALLEKPPEFLELGGLSYLLCHIKSFPTEAVAQELAQLALSESLFEYHNSLGEFKGPFLKPLNLNITSALPRSLISTRRYTGKTNEAFTHFMCNLARFSSDFAHTPWSQLSLLDPLSGGGTSLWIALVLGADAAGVELNKKVAEGTPEFLKGFLKEAQIPFQCQNEKIKKKGQRWIFKIQQQRCILSHGDTQDTPAFITGLKRPKLLVTDLPYNIQHLSDWQALLSTALPQWYEVLAPGGAMAFSWNATRFQREQMIALVEGLSDFEVLKTQPYETLGHQVDRVIKLRDVLVAHKPSH